MNNNFDIFNAVEVPTGELTPFAQFKEIGDGVQGTFVGRKDGQINQKFGHVETIVLLKQYDGNLIQVSIRENKTFLLNEVNKCKLGDIIGFKFTGTRPSQKGNPTKVIVLVRDENLVDKEWLAEQSKRVDSLRAQLEESNPMSAGQKLEQELPFVTDSDKILKISTVIKTKFGVSSEEEIKDKVLSETGLAFLPVNLDLILARLK